jgi:hypothetical protein
MFTLIAERCAMDADADMDAMDGPAQPSQVEHDGVPAHGAHNGLDNVAVTAVVGEYLVKRPRSPQRPQRLLLA